MAVRGVAGDEHAPDLVFLRDRDAQVPEPDVIELGLERKPGRLVQQGLEIEIVPRGVLRHRRVEEEALADVDPAEELPVAVEIRVHGAIDRLRRKALAELVVQLARAQHDQHHELIEVVAAARNADLLAHDGMAAVAADQIIALQHLARAIPGDGDARAVRVLLDLGGGPAEAALDVRQASPSWPAAPFPSGTAAAGRSSGSSSRGPARGPRARTNSRPFRSP